MHLLALLQNQMTDFSTLPLWAIIRSTPPPALGPKVTIVERVKHDNFTAINCILSFSKSHQALRQRISELNKNVV